LNEDDIQRAARAILDSIQIIALTGAGISEESGIPDFRSPGGLWSRYDPYLYGSYESFVDHPERFWEMAGELNPTMENAQPNPAHYALAELERLGKCRAVITQNIDNLHQEAGSREVLELHGTHRTGHCMICRRPFSFEEMRELSMGNTQVPRCPDDQGAIKPDVILFGEPIDAKAISKAAELASGSDLMLVVGCSLEVYPAAALPEYTRRRKGKLISVNIVSTFYDCNTDVICMGKAGKVLPALVEAYKKLAGII
jgi:NAD-dependent deacetylase